MTNIPLEAQNHSNDDAAGNRSNGFSLVVAMYDVARFLEDFFASLEKQSYSFEELDIILVDDGSTDATFDVAETWAGRHNNVKVLHKENGGQASARNYGLLAASNEWVCFVDPDDMLHPSYFSEARNFITFSSGADVSLYATNPIYFDEATGNIRNGHPLRGRFSGGNRVVNLNGYPNSLQMQATTAFFRLSVLQKHDIKFGTRIRPTFEDAHFVSNYLLRFDEPTVGIVATSKYIYRKRADGTSTLQTSHGDKRKYTDVPRYGLLDILRQAAILHGDVPAWLKNVVLYDIFWLFKSDRSIYSSSAGLEDAVFEEFHEILKEILEFIAEPDIMAFDAMPIAMWMRQALAWGHLTDRRVTDYAIVRPLDAQQNLVKLTYRFSGDLPTEELTIRGSAVAPKHAKIQAHAFFRRTMISERILWVSAKGTIRLTLDGKSAKLLFDEPNRPDTVLLPSKIKAMRSSMTAAVPWRYRQPVTTHRKYVTGWAKKQANIIAQVWRSHNLEAIRTAWALRSKTTKRRYASAWVLMDRDNEANDSAEELYHWLAANKPNINAWYVLRKDAPDWKRLEDSGVKLAAYGTFQWRLLMLSAVHYASSHIDNYVVKPLDYRIYGPRRWRFTFLQHGVIKGDLSRWLNHKSIDLFVTSTKNEYDSIAGDASPYRFSTKEVRLTGLPRHDALLRKRQVVDSPDLILIAPTWRSYLVPQNASTSTDRERSAEFSSSKYVEHYRELLHSPRLKAVAEANDLTIAFMPHPNTQPYMDTFNVPDYVEVKRYGVDDVQQVMAETMVMVTDYSSIAFNIAYLDSAVVYFQFDQDEYFGGGHTERPSYFNYVRDGFGPVTTTVDMTVDAVKFIAKQEGPSTEYLRRIESTFPVRDGNNSQRVYKAMLSTSRELSFRGTTEQFEKQDWKYGAAVRESDS